MSAGQTHAHPAPPPRTGDRAQEEAVRSTRSTCPYCGVGCGVLIDTVGNRIVGVRGDPQHPANYGRLCTKGSTLHATADPVVAQQVRLLQPQQRLRRDAPWSPVSWDSALDWAADRLSAIVQQHGPESVAFYVSGQLLTEDYYVFHKLARGLIGTPHIDSNSRLCMSSAVVGYKWTLGADAPPACYEDIDHADCVFIVGSNTAWAHPVLFRRLEAAKERRPQLRVIVADPRRTDTASLADLYLPIQPGTDVALFHGLLHLMLTEGWIDAEYIAQHTEGFDGLRTVVQDYPPALVAQICGVPEADLRTAARRFAGVPDGHGDKPLPRQQRLRTLSLYCQGLNQYRTGTAKNMALIHLHLACGQIGRPGAGPLSLTGQPNAMGGREVGAMATLLSAHRDLANPAHRAEVAALWGLAEGATLPDRPGLTAVDMFQAAADGAIKALWIACTNPAQSLPNQRVVRAALQRAELVVVQEAYASAATCAFADLLLPATTWGEKDGTVTNSERRISRVRAAVAPPCIDPATAPRHDWAIAVALGRRLEHRLPRRSQTTLFPYESPEQIWNEHRASTRGRDLDITGLSYAALEAAPQQWPCPAGATSGLARLYEDGHFPTPSGRARFVAVSYEPLAEERSQRYPYALLTGRLRDQWHGMTRTGTLPALFGHVSEPQLAMHPADMAEAGLTSGALVRVRSKRAELVVPAVACDEVGRRQCFLPMHWGGEFLGGRAADGEIPQGVNALTSPAYCPHSHQPELKYTAVDIQPVQLSWHVQAMGWLPATDVLRAQRRLRPWLARFDYAVCVPFAAAGHSVVPAVQEGQPPQALHDASDADAAAQVGLWFRAASDTPPADASTLLACLTEIFGLDGPLAARLDDPVQHRHRRVRLQADPPHRLAAFAILGDTRSTPWLAQLLHERQPWAAPLVRLLDPMAHAVAPTVAPRDRRVCQCFGVGESAIVDCLRRTGGDGGQRLAHLQAQLRCGTQCGSCLPELKRLVQTTPMVEQQALSVSAEGAVLS